MIPVFLANEFILSTVSPRWADLSPNACKLGMVWLSLLSNEVWPSDPYGLTDLSMLPDAQVKEAEMELTNQEFLVRAAPSYYTMLRPLPIRLSEHPSAQSKPDAVTFPSECVFNQYWAKLSPEACKVFVVLRAIGKGNINSGILMMYTKMPEDDIFKAMEELKDKGAVKYELNLSDLSGKKNY